MRPELVLQVAHQVEDLRLHRDIERGSRLVADNELGLGCQRAGDRNALALPAGKFVRVLPAIVGMQADQGEKFADAAFYIALALDQVEGADRFGDDGIDPQARIEAGVGILENHLDAAAQMLARLQLPGVAHRNAVDDNFARCRRQQADDHPGDGGLARAGFADQRESLAFGDIEGDAVDGLEIFRTAPSSIRLSHGFETSNTRRRFLTSTKGGAVMPRSSFAALS